MKTIFLLIIFLLFHFPLITSQIYSFSKTQNEDDDCKHIDTLEIEANKTYEKIYQLINKCYPSTVFILRLNVHMIDSNYDLIKFTLVNIGRNSKKISFYLNNNTIEAFKEDTEEIKLKLSDIKPGDYVIEIYKQVRNKRRQYNITLNYTFSSYPNTRRFKDKDEYILYPNNTDELIYEYGILNDKVIIFKIFGNDVNGFDFSYGINESNSTKVDKIFFNGYLLSMDLNFFKDSKDIQFFVNNFNENLTIITYPNNSEEKKLDGNNNHFDIILNNLAECFILDLSGAQKFIFKFTTYTKKITFFNISQENINITEESCYYILDADQNEDEICFQKINEYKNDEAALSFDFLKFENNTVNNYYKIMRGLPQRNILYEGMVGYYKPEYYNNITSEAVINSHVIKGNPIFYIFEDNDNNSLTGNKTESINGYISYKYKLKEEPIYAKVECLSTECIFDIDMKGVDEITYFKKDYKIFSFLNDSYSDKYKININGIDNNNYLLINIYYFIHKPNVEIYNLKNDSYKIEIKPFENVILYNILINEIVRENSENILIKITTDNPEGIYYGLKYEINREGNKNIYLEKGIALIYDLKNDINSENFIINQKTDSKLIINANTFGNDLVLIMNGQNYRAKNNLIHIELNKTEKKYSFKIINNSVYSEQYINLYIYQPSSDSKIFLKEGILYNNKLTKDNNEIKYSLFLKKNNEYKLNVRKYSHSNIQITINKKTLVIKKLSELINFDKTDCKKEICEYSIKIEKENKENPETEVYFSFQIITYNETIYLPKNTLMNGILEKEKTIVYNGTFKNSDELFIDFLEGEGEATLIILDDTNNKSYTMDYYNKKFYLTEYKCNDFCKFELILKLKSNDNLSNKYKYNILLRDSTSIVSIPAFETIYGILKKDNKEHTYTIKNISKYYNYELDCYLCEFIEEEQTEDEIKFKIKLKDTQKINFDVYYNFRINFYDNENVVLYHLNSVRNHHYCQLNAIKPCYYLTFIEEYNELANLQFLVQNIQKAEINYTSYNNDKTEKEIYDEIVEDTINYERLNRKNYLNIKNEDGNYNGCYILLKVTANNENNISLNLVYDIFKRNYTSMENIYKDDFCLINSDMNIKLINTKTEYYILDINLLEGEGKIEFNTDKSKNENKIYYLKKDFKENLNIFSSSNKNYTINLTLQEKAPITYYRRIKSKNKANIKEIYFGKSNYLTYEKQDKISYLSFYINLNDAIINEDIHLNYKFLEIFKENYPEDINLEILLVGEEYIFNEKGGLNNNNLNYPNLGDIIYYKKDMGAGYALINKSFIFENKEENNYIYIKLKLKSENTINHEFDFVITLTDFSEYYDMPINIYLFMFIKNESKLKIKKDYEESAYKPFVEISHDCNLTVKFNQENITQKNIHGKTLYGLQNGTYIFTFNNKESEFVKAPNLLIKYGFSEKEDYSYFRLNESKINYTDSNKNIYFNLIENISEYSDYSVIYNILIYDKKNSYDKIFEKKEPIARKIYKERDIPISIFDQLEGKIGTFYINILAEAKIKNVNTDNYEYILYECSEIHVKVDINIEEKEKSFNFSRTEDLLINANISKVEDNLIQYKFIKLVLIEKNYYRKKLEIYAFLNDQDQEGKSLYERSEYKSVDSYNKTVLAIPLDNGEDSQLDKLYIRIPCKAEQEFQLIYRIEDGRKMEGISIHENTCFDILLKEIPNDGKNLNYRFVYTINKINYPLITFTTYEINNDYKIITTGMENEYLKKSFYNGYSFLFQYSDDYYEYHTFIIIPRITTIFKICHRTIEKIEQINEKEVEVEEKYKFKPISIGENIYTFLRNKKGILKDCFEINTGEEANYEKYMFNYISKTQNIRLLINDKEKEDNNPLYLFNESGSIFLNSSEVTNFCIGLRLDASSILAKEYHGSINFQIVGINITQNENIPLIPLINGYSVKHTLQPGQKLYYRLNKYIIDSKYLELYFQILQGNISIKQSNCSNYPNYSCTDNFEEILDKSIYENNYYHHIKIDGNDIYNKADFPVYHVYCNETFNKNCVYYIGMNNNNSILALNEKRKIYFRPKENRTIKFTTDFYGEEFVPYEEEEEENHENSRKYYLEIHLLEGGLDASNIFINGSNNLHNFDKKTYYYSPVPSKLNDVGFYSFPCNLTLIEESLVYITYHILLNKTYEGTKVDDIYNMYEDEMHYNLLTPNLETFSYYYPKLDFENNTKNETYMVSISSINSYISVDNSEYKKYHQKILFKNVTQIKCDIEDSERNSERQCEFIFSFAKLNNNSKSICKKVEFDGFYQYYEINCTIKICLYYDLNKEELNESYILVTINKDNLEQLTINYGVKDNIEEKEEYCENLTASQSKNINKRIEIFKIDLKTLEDESNIQLGNNTKNNNKKYLLFRLTSKNNINFKIKINIKNNPTHLYLDENEFGYLEPGDSLYYYFDYMPQNDKKTSKDLEEIYLYNKGKAKMLVVISENSEDYPYNLKDMYNINYDDPSIKYNDTESENNHFKITNILGKNNNFGFRVYIKVYLDKISNIDTNYSNFFSIYRNTQKGRGRLIKFNTNNFGNIYVNNSENYKFYANNLTKIKGSLIINLDCNTCSLKCYGQNKSYFQINSSYIFNWKDHLNEINDDKLLFNISGEKGYYFFSLSDSNLPKYIEESEPELCLGSCKFVFPLYNYYDYKNVENNITQIIFFSPDVEKIKIYVKNVSESDIKNDPLSDFDLTKNNSQDFNNKRFYELNISEIAQKSYLRIQVTSDDKNQIFQFIMNKFIKSKNTEIKHTKQIIYLNKNETKNNIFSKDEKDSNFYKFNLELISGKGNIILAQDKENNFNYEYELDYEYHPSISVILELNNYSISAYNLDTENNFTFFINVTKLGKNYKDIAAHFDYAKNYRIKYYINESENLDIFPLNLKVGCKQGYTTFVSYRFIKNEYSRKKPDLTLYNSTDLDFYVDSKNTIEKNKLYFESIYYPDFKRGVIIVKPNENYNENYIDLILNKSENNIGSYKNIYLEVALVYLNNKEDENIYIPKNAYVQFDLNDTNKNYTLEFFEPDPEYKHFQIEIANTYLVNITSGIENCTLEKIYGKNTCCYENNSTNNNNTIIINSNSSVTVFVKYTTRKNESEFPYFNITDININKWLLPNDGKKGDNETKFNLTQKNITTNYNNTFLTFFVRLYDYLRFYDNEEMYSIMVRSNGNMSFRMDYGETPQHNKSNNKTFNYIVNFGYLKKETYFINIIGEVTFNDSVEYLSYNYTTFRLSNIDNSIFDQNWIIPLVFVLLMFCAIAGYIIYFNIKKYKQEKIKKRENAADIIINEEEKEKGMEDIKDKDKEDNDEEDNNEEDNNEENNNEENNDESYIKI